MSGVLDKTKSQMSGKQLGDKFRSNNRQSAQMKRNTRDMNSELIEEVDESDSDE